MTDFWENYEEYQAFSSFFRRCLLEYFKQARDGKVDVMEGNVDSDAGFTGFRIYEEDELEFQWDVSWNYGGYEQGSFSVDAKDFFAFAENQWKLAEFDRQLSSDDNTEVSP